jgi:hypothetical protein
LPVCVDSPPYWSHLYFAVRLCDRLATLSGVDFEFPQSLRVGIRHVSTIASARGRIMGKLLSKQFVIVPPARPGGRTREGDRAL